MSKITGGALSTLLALGALLHTLGCIMVYSNDHMMLFWSLCAGVLIVFGILIGDPWDPRPVAFALISAGLVAFSIRVKPR